MKKFFIQCIGGSVLLSGLVIGGEAVMPGLLLAMTRLFPVLELGTVPVSRSLTLAMP
jgi:hypothetical protein